MGDCDPNLLGNPWYSHGPSLPGQDLRSQRPWGPAESLSAAPILPDASHVSRSPTAQPPRHHSGNVGDVMEDPQDLDGTMVISILLI